MQTTPKPDWQPRGESTLQNQLQTYDQMRRDCPVARDADGRWTLFRHADVMRVLLDHQSFSNNVSRHVSVPNGMDQPEHSLYRPLIEPYFSHERVEAFAPVCREIAQQLAEQQLAGKDQVELMQQFARPFAARLQCAFMGWPQELAGQLLSWLERNQNAVRQQDREKLSQLAAEFNRLTSEQIDLRRKQSPEQDTDVTTELMHEQVNGRPLELAEITSILRNWTAGEVGTIAAAIGIIAHFLATRPQLQQQLRSNPQLLWYANDEILRLHNPLLENRRRTTCPVRIGQRDIEQNASLSLNWVAANRDPRVFDQADKFSWERDPGNNLLYGAGIHVCPGAGLARMELVTAIDAVLQHCSSLQLQPEQTPIYARYPASGFASLHLHA